jgi:Fe2+ or Zn2+ uptake regulation protein
MILETIRSTDTHPTADWIYHELKKRIPEISLGTVYRGCKVLVELGYIKKIPFGSTFDRFDARVEPHYHLVCEQCGCVKDIAMPQIESIDRRAEEVSDFRITRHRIEFFGICDSCRNTENHKSSRKRGAHGNKRN